MSTDTAHQTDPGRDARDAHAWRLRQAEQLLREAGYVQQPDGTWQPVPRAPS